MKKILNRITLIQIGTAFAFSIFLMSFSVFYYMIYGQQFAYKFDPEIHLDTLLALLKVILIQTFFIFIIGLAIRLLNRINEWWIKNLKIQMVLIIIGIAFVIVSWTSDFAVITRNGVKYPNPLYFALGWCIITFVILHFYPLGKKISKYDRNRD